MNKRLHTPLRLTGILLGLLLSTYGTKAQVAYELLKGNSIEARINADGQLFWTGKKAHFNAPAGSGTNTISAAGLWIGGLDAGKNLHLSAQTYKTTGSDFWTGPLDSNGICVLATSSSYNKVWKVSKLEIDSFIAGLSIPSSILSWPGNGDQSKGLPAQLAPYVDKDGDGRYNPANGDYPKIEGDVMLWWVFNDGVLHGESGGRPLNVEIQASAYAYACEDPILSNAIFLKYKIINRGKNDYDSLYAGLWSDFDIGNPFDDYVGCDTLRNAFYAYNSDAMDGDTLTVRADTLLYKGFGRNLPVQSLCYLQGLKNDMGKSMPMSNFIYLRNDDTVTSVQGNPQKALHYYDYLKGLWLDGKPITEGGNGYGGTKPTKYAYPGNPLKSADWTEISADNLKYDRSAIGSFGPVSLAAGKSQEITTAFLFSRASSGKTAKSLALMQDQLTTLQSMYAKGALHPCTGISVCMAGDTCVYPGDANNDGLASSNDIFNIGYAFGSTGPARNFASSAWAPQHAANWGRKTPDGKDYKFMDGNGDGRIDSADVLPILYNYAEKHKKTETTNSTNATDPLLYLKIFPKKVKPGQEFTVQIKLGNAAISASDVLGFALDLDYNPLAIDSGTGKNVHSDGSYLDDKDSGILIFERDDHANGKTNVSGARKSKTGITDSGVISSVKYIITDNISGGVKPKQYIGISGALVVDHNLKSIPVRLAIDSLEIDFTGLAENMPELAARIQLYPNPATTEIQLVFHGLKPESVRVFNLTGQQQSLVIPGLNANTLELNTSALATGIYLLEVQTDYGLAVKKFSITR